MEIKATVPPAYRPLVEDDPAIPAFALFYNTQTETLMEVAKEMIGTPTRRFGALMATNPIFVPIVDRGEMLRILGGFNCVCGLSKAGRRSHCPRCYRLMPPEMQKSLYKKFGAGYEEAFLESLNFLIEDGRTTPEKIRAILPAPRVVEGSARLEGRS